MRYTEIYYYTSSNIIKGIESFNDGIQEGLSLYFWMDGVVSDKINYKNGKQHGLKEEYNFKGELMNRNFMCEGNCDKYYTYYDFNHQLECHVIYL
jgi:antitoxin component YwqK of YwqJK toxin-antitoxin module